MKLLKLYQNEWKQNKRSVQDLWIGEEHNYVFHGGFGKPLYLTYPSEWWRIFTEKHNLKRISLHGLRHNFTTTANIYTHVTQKVSREAANNSMT